MANDRLREVLGPNWNFECHPEVSLMDLINLSDVGVICEAERKDSDGERFFVYTVAGKLNGQTVAAVDHINKVVHGALIEGDAIIVHGRDRKEADWVALNGLVDTILMFRQQYEEQGTLDPGKNAGTIVTAEAKPLLR